MAGLQATSFEYRVVSEFAFAVHVGLGVERLALSMEAEDLALVFHNNLSFLFDVGAGFRYLLGAWDVDLELDQPFGA